MQKIRFAGHESFICKQFWLQKGFGYVQGNGSFTADESVVRLGVGKNMVASIRYWLRSFGLIDEADEPTKLGTRILGENGWDPHLEEIGTIWLLHYQLVVTGYASIYAYVFNSFQVGRPQFSQEQLNRYLVRICEEEGINVSDATLERDVSVFLRSYLRPSIGKKSDLEEDFTRLLIELELLHKSVVFDPDGNKAFCFEINRNDKDSLPWQVVLYSILDQIEDGELTVSFDRMHKTPNSPGIVFALSEEDFRKKIDEIQGYYPKIIYSETAGVKVIQFPSSIEKFEVLNEYYNG